MAGCHPGPSQEVAGLSSQQNILVISPTICVDIIAPGIRSGSYARGRDKSGPCICGQPIGQQMPRQVHDNDFAKLESVGTYSRLMFQAGDLIVSNTVYMAVHPAACTNSVRVPQTVRQASKSSFSTNDVANASIFLGRYTFFSDFSVESIAPRVNKGPWSVVIV